MKHLKIYENFDELDPFGEETTNKDKTLREEEDDYWHPTRYIKGGEDYFDQKTPDEKILDYYDAEFGNRKPKFEEKYRFIKNMSQKFGLSRKEVLDLLGINGW